MKRSRHFSLLAGILILGTILRFWQLDSKPVWLDEVITALFSLGRSYNVVPLDRAFPLSLVEQIFTLKPETTCAQIVYTVSTQSVHPPLFFCWMHDWFNWLRPVSLSWIWKLRAFPAFVGVVTITALYLFNRVAFSPAAGLLGAAIMAVSPFAVYLSQEGRHYTLPMLLVIAALLGLYQIHCDLKTKSFRPAIWLGWVAVNSLGFYVHYFFILAFIAQVVTLLVFAWTETSNAPAKMRRYSWLAIALAIAGIGLTYLPWLPTFLKHMRGPETDWIALSGSHWTDVIAPLYQLPASWVVMVIALPVEDQPLWLAIPMIVVMLLFAGWLFWHLFKTIRTQWHDPTRSLAIRMLVIFILVVVLEFLAIVYLLGKDITQVPRYGFIYFPAVCALLGASLSAQPVLTTKQPIRYLRIIGATVLVGILSSILVVTNITFQKPYRPDQVAQQFQIEPELPLFVGMAYGDYQDVALGLSFAHALSQQRDKSRNDTYFTFLARSQSYAQVWRSLASLQQPLKPPLNLWFIAPGLRRSNYPNQLQLSTTDQPTNCLLDSQHHYRQGVPYQLYRCQK